MSCLVAAPTFCNRYALKSDPFPLLDVCSILKKMDFTHHNPAVPSFIFDNDQQSEQK